MRNEEGIASERKASAERGAKIASALRKSKPLDEGKVTFYTKKLDLLVGFAQCDGTEEGD